MPQCARCNKAVYPLEELKCLDKVWHKGCFKCTECSMTLNMKTYKGLNKQPYCEAHIPKAKATTVADTPELKRIQENTKIQSNAVYHAEFEKSKGKFTPVVDDPELLRIKQNSKIISNVSYHGDLAKKALMEQKRILSGEGDRNGFSSPKSPTYMDELSALPTPVTQSVNSGPSKHSQPPQYQPPPPSHTPSHGSYRNAPNHYPEPDYEPQTPPHYTGRPTQQYNQGMSSSPYSSRGTANVIYSSEMGAVQANSPRKVGSIADYDPVNNYYGSLDPQRSQGPTGRIPSSHGIQQQQMKQPTPPQPARAQPHPDYGVCYRALYDYEAQDSDEISFKDGDLIIECSAVDEGWMTGTVHRTGYRGMLPANYVTPA